MQKLIYINSENQEIDLTKAPFGVTSWKGLSEISMEVQSQQVPFEDGSVYLDNLLENRDVSITVAIQDNGNLKLRYELKRFLIHNLNPKLGEGKLIYENNFIKKQLICIPDVPTFNNKNSNDVGTEKALLTFTACNPYWEDIEDTIVDFSLAEQPVIENDGDVDVPVKMDINTSYAKNLKILNLSTKKKITFSETITDPLTINTGLGQKNITSKELKFGIDLVLNNIISIASNEDIIIAISEYYGAIIASYDGENWFSLEPNFTAPNLIDFSGYPTKIIYSYDTGLFYLFTSENSYSSNDGFNWTAASSTNGIIISFDACCINENETDFLYSVGSYYINTKSGDNAWVRTSVGDSDVSLTSIIYSKILNKFIVGGKNGLIMVSDDASDWSSEILFSYDIKSIVECKFLNKIYIVTEGETYETTDLSNFTSIGQCFLSLYSDEIGKKLIASGPFGWMYTSFNGVLWEKQEQRHEVDFFAIITFLPAYGLYLAGGTNGAISRSNDGITWEISKSTIPFNIDTNQNIRIYQLIKLNGIYFCVGSRYDGTFFLSVSFDKYKTNQAVYEFGSYLKTLTYGKDKYLAIEATNIKRCRISYDGYFWKTVTIPDDARWETIQNAIFSETFQKFYVCGSNLISSSETADSAESWTSTTSSQTPDMIYLLKEDSGKLYAAANYGVLYISDDGENWTRKEGPDVGSASNQYKYMLVHNGIILMLVGNQVYRSVDDGDTWEKVVDENNNIATMVYDSSRNIFVVFMADKIKYSSDGITWTTENSNFGTFSNSCEGFEDEGEYYVYDKKYYIPNIKIGNLSKFEKRVFSANRTYLCNYSDMTDIFYKSKGSFIWNNRKYFILRFALSIQYYIYYFLIDITDMKNIKVVFIPNDRYEMEEIYKGIVVDNSLYLMTDLALKYASEIMTYNNNEYLFLTLASLTHFQNIYASKDKLYGYDINSDEFLEGIVQDNNTVNFRTLKSFSSSVGFLKLNANDYLLINNNSRILLESLSNEKISGCIYSETLQKYIVVTYIYIASGNYQVKLYLGKNDDWENVLTMNMYDGLNIKFIEAINRCQIILYTRFNGYYISSDGRNWVNKTSPFTGMFYIGGRYVTVSNISTIMYNESMSMFFLGFQKKLATSSDGENWETKNNTFYFDSQPVGPQVIYLENSIIYISSIGVGSSFYEDSENIINLLTIDSDMNFKLKKGTNQIRLVTSEGEVQMKLSFRKRYIGL